MFFIALLLWRYFTMIHIVGTISFLVQPPLGVIRLVYLSMTRGCGMMGSAQKITLQMSYPVPITFLGHHEALQGGGGVV